MSAMIDHLGLSPKEQQSLQGTLGKIKSVSEFLKDFVEATKETNFLEKLAECCPWWLGAVGHAFAQAAPPIRFMSEFLKRATEITDPDRLNYLAFTLAYQRSLQLAAKVVGRPANPQSNGALPKTVTVNHKGMSFAEYTITDALNHQFIKDADGLLATAMQVAGYSSGQQRLLMTEVHLRFPGQLRQLITHPETREKYTSLMQTALLGPSPDRAISAWNDHHDYLRYLFEEEPLFKQEPFALGDIYVETECGSLSWDDVRSKKMKDFLAQGKATGGGKSADASVDPFDERCGGRHKLVDEVMRLISDPDFSDAIVIQGPAGAGKSAFTLRLAIELLRQSLRPIRVRFRDIPLHQNNIEEALPEAVRFWDEFQRTDDRPKAKPNELFATILEDRTEFNGALICPWVIIVDGWDEVSVAAERGFAVRVKELLEELRSWLLQRGGRPKIRLIVTGRPSHDVTSPSFMRKETQLLTIRSLTPAQLNNFVPELAGRLVNPNKRELAAPDRFAPVLEAYRQFFDGKKSPTDEAGAGLDLLGSPLLAHLAVRLMVESESDDLKEFVANPSTLYRRLTDLTCYRGGRVGKDAFDPNLQGPKLRRLLQQTAAAMTVFGRDSIPFEELDARLEDLDKELCDHVAEHTAEQPLTALMINFFFKGGRKELGAEFLHKSFREYLFAECIVEKLREYGLEAKDSLPERPVYWKDFPEDDVRFALSRDLAKLLGPQWLTPEVIVFLEGLLEWELDRSHEQSKTEVPVENLANPATDLETVAIPLNCWNRVRDALADLWDWWGEGVHLRPAITIKARQYKGVEAAPVQEFIEWALPQRVTADEIPPSIRSTSIDAHLGDALFRLNCWIHLWAAVRPGDRFPWAPTKEGQPGTYETPPRRYQAQYVVGSNHYIRFAPSQPHPSYWTAYRNRINSANWNPQSFPSGARCDGIVIRSAWSADSFLLKTSLRGVDFESNLFSSIMNYCDLSYSFMNNIIIIGEFNSIELEGAFIRARVLSKRMQKRLEKMAARGNINSDVGVFGFNPIVDEKVYFIQSHDKS